MEIAQVVGIEGHNPSGHCLIASKLIDSIPLPIAADENLPSSKKQALDQENHSSELTPMPEEISVVCTFVFNTLQDIKRFIFFSAIRIITSQLEFTYVLSKLMRDV